jgi:SAM-dependent methyltransferase
MSHRPAWQLPPGVSAGTWDYLESELVADDYDDYFAHHRLFQVDQQLVRDVCSGSPRGVVIDLGCGTGRHLLPLAAAGMKAIGVDLSWHMLRVLAAKAARQGRKVSCLRCNLVELDALADEMADHALCMFSTLGMIQGRKHRRRFLAHVHRLLRPGGSLVLHVHNYWYHLRDPGGPRWLLSNLLASCFRSDVERGDREFSYRGVPRMFLHAYRKGELRRDLARAGFTVDRLIPLSPRGEDPLGMAWLLPSLRAIGWLVVARRSTSSG